MARKSKEYLNKLKKKYSVNQLWSWSRINTYMNSPYEYYLKYIKKEPTDKNDGIYCIQGNICHQILENLYLKNIKYEDMITEYEKNLFDLELGDFKYNRTDEEKNLQIANTYENSIRNFFKNHIQINKKIIIEQFITIKIDKYIFQGYIDLIFKKDNIYHILDWKTSTIYKGQKQEKESKQLKLYALALYQRGIPLEKIKIGWNFLKYQNITYKQKNGKLKTVSLLRNENWMQQTTLKKNILSHTKDLKLNTKKIEELILNENFNSFPSELKELYKIEDCYVWVDLTEEKMKELENEIIKTIKEIEIKTKEYNQNQNDEIFCEEIEAKNLYYFYNICNYSREKHKPFNNYLEQLEMFVDDKNEYEF